MKLAALVLPMLVTACAPTLAGKLKAPDGMRAGPEARVNVSRLDGDQAGAVLVIEVAEDGTWSTDADLPEGRYLVEAVAPGFALASRTITLGEEESVEFELKPITRPKATAIGANVDGDAARGAGGATLTPPNL